MKKIVYFHKLLLDNPVYMKTISSYLCMITIWHISSKNILKYNFLTTTEFCRIPNVHELYNKMFNTKNFVFICFESMYNMIFNWIEIDKYINYWYITIHGKVCKTLWQHCTIVHQYNIFEKLCLWKLCTSFIYFLLFLTDIHNNNEHNRVKIILYRVHTIITAYHGKLCYYFKSTICQ